jgi:hypothetical protein
MGKESVGVESDNFHLRAMKDVKAWRRMLITSLIFLACAIFKRMGWSQERISLFLRRASMVSHGLAWGCCSAGLFGLVLFRGVSRCWDEVDGPEVGFSRGRAACSTTGLTAFLVGAVFFTALPIGVAPFVADFVAVFLGPCFVATGSREACLGVSCWASVTLPAVADRGCWTP